MDISRLYNIFRKCGSVSTDSRSIKGGELFFALKGENFDGNAYAVKALQAGAKYSVVSADFDVAGEYESYTDEDGESRLIPVDDTLETLKELATFHRENVYNFHDNLHDSLHGRQGRLPIIGITGTNGKTTTKELIRSVLSEKYRVTATKGNLNNDIGVPLSLLSITLDTEIAVIEMGANHPEDIASLVKVSRPDYGLITNVGKAHLQGFGSFEGVCRAKGRLYDYLNENGGQVFINADDEVLVGMASERGMRRLLPYGIMEDKVKVLPVTARNPFLSIEFEDGYVMKTSLIGTYNVSNVLAALRIGRYFGVPEADARAAIEAYEPSNSRSQMLQTKENTLIVDAYNANPSSMKAALENFSNLISTRKAAMLGDMRELGADSLAEHKEILERAMSCGATLLCFVGEEFGKVLKMKGSMDELCKLEEERLEENKDKVIVRWYPDSDSLAKALQSNPLSGYTVLVKGSRGIQMEKAIPFL